MVGMELAAGRLVRWLQGELSRSTHNQRLGELDSAAASCFATQATAPISLPVLIPYSIVGWLIGESVVGGAELSIAAESVSQQPRNALENWILLLPVASHRSYLRSIPSPFCH